MITITITMLEQMPRTGARACSPARQWFAKAFPDGGNLGDVWDACPHWQWKFWFALHSAHPQAVVEFARDRADAAAVAAARASLYAEEAPGYAHNAVRATEAAEKAARAASAARYATVYASAPYYAADCAAEIAWARGVLFG